jgi:hypothetical protein
MKASGESTARKKKSFSGEFGAFGRFAPEGCSEVVSCARLVNVQPKVTR